MWITAQGIRTLTGPEKNVAEVGYYAATSILSQQSAWQLLSPNSQATPSARDLTLVVDCMVNESAVVQPYCSWTEGIVVGVYGGFLLALEEEIRKGCGDLLQQAAIRAYEQVIKHAGATGILESFEVPLSQQDAVRLVTTLRDAVLFNDPDQCETLDLEEGQRDWISVKDGLIRSIPSWMRCQVEFVLGRRGDRSEAAAFETGLDDLVCSMAGIDAKVSERLLFGLTLCSRRVKLAIGLSGEDLFLARLDSLLDSLLKIAAAIWGDGEDEEPLESDSTEAIAWAWFWEKMFAGELRHSEFGSIDALGLGSAQIDDAHVAARELAVSLVTCDAGDLCRVKSTVLAVLGIRT